MSDAPAGLAFRPLGLRVRQLSPAPANAIATRREPFDAVDLYYSELRDDWLAGRIKQVANSLRADNRTIHTSFSMIGVSVGEWGARADRHRGLLLRELRFQYKNAVIRAAAANPRNAKRLRERVNHQIGSAAPDPAKVDALFADQPSAIAAAKDIRALIAQIEETAHGR